MGVVFGTDRGFVVMRKVPAGPVRSDVVAFRASSGLRRRTRGGREVSIRWLFYLIIPFLRRHLGSEGNV